MKHLSSTQNPQVKHWVRLRTQRSYRKEQNALLVVGKKMVRELLQTQYPRILILREGEEAPEGVPVIWVSDRALKKMTGLEAPDGWAAECPFPSYPWPSHPQRILVIDRLADPGNLGTILRTAWALNWEGIFFVGHHVDPFNEKALRAARGATFHLPMRTGTWEELEALVTSEKGVLLAADLEGEPPERMSIQQPLYLVLSHEGGGLNLSQEHLRKVSIPMSEHVESLNVAVAGSILMYCLRNPQ